MSIRKRLPSPVDCSEVLDRTCLVLALEVLFDPKNKVVLESSLYYLMKEVGRYQLVNISVWEIIGEGLQEQSSLLDSNEHLAVH